MVVYLGNFHIQIHIRIMGQKISSLISICRLITNSIINQANLEQNCYDMLQIPSSHLGLLKNFILLWVCVFCRGLA
jgi:hypothetical protein